MAEITITKIDAAQRQLRMAIRLWFAEADPLCTQVLARHAYQIVHDIHWKVKKADILLAGMKEEHKGFLRRMLNDPTDFAKHSDRGRVGKLPDIILDTDITKGFIIGAIAGLQDMQQDLAYEEHAFNFWHHIHEPELCTDAGQQFFKDHFKVEVVNVLRAMPKDEFFKRVLNVLRRDRAAHNAPPAVMR